MDDLWLQTPSGSRAGTAPWHYDESYAANEDQDVVTSNWPNEQGYNTWSLENTQENEIPFFF